MSAPDPTAQALAERVAEWMFAQDAATRAMGMEVLAVTPTSARLAMSVRDDMLNGHQTCHGGMIFTLADSAFAFACNADNHLTVALACQITFVTPARAGDRLIAEACQVVRAGRTGVFDCTITRADGAIIATFRGNSYRTRGHLVEDA